MTERDPRHVQIAVSGTGFAGLGAAIRLKQAGFHDFLVFERAEEVGGTWRDNSYPGCACDVESDLYSFSFAPNPSWSRLFSPQPEILAYLRRCAEDFGILPHVRFGHEIREAAFNDAEQRWYLETSHGTFTADVLIGGSGPLSEPSIPNLKGLSSFKGKVFHSARWDHAYDLAGKRVGVVGTGASAIQFVPAIQPRVAHLTLFQRTPAWVVPRIDREVSEREHRLYRALPFTQRLSRAAIYARREAFVLGFRNPSIMRYVEKFALRYLERKVPDPILRKKLTPNFRLGCKRVLISQDYLPALNQPNVHVETSSIVEVRAHSIVTADGQEHEVDALIFGTGFHVTDIPFAHRVRNGAGHTLHDAWQGSPSAHYGTTVAGFPNLFLLLGPNTGLGHTSVVLMIESQLKIVLGALEHMRRHRCATVEPRLEAQQAYNAELAQKTEGTVWTSGGCASWYIDESGRNSTLWPGFTFSFMRRCRFRPEEYELAPRSRLAEDRRRGTDLSGDLGPPKLSTVAG